MTAYKKKILIIHTNYRNLGGEDVAVKNESKFLERYFDIENIYLSNKENNYFFLASSLIFNRNFKNYRIIKNKLITFNPDIVYIHNTWFDFPLMLFKLFKKLNITVIKKIHNYRIGCTSTYSFKKHLQGYDFCPACGIKNSNYIFNKYFYDSIIKSFFVIKHSRKLLKYIKSESITVLALNKFQSIKLAALGISIEKIQVFPNYLDFEPKDNNKSNKEKYILYAGRISKEKGVEELIRSFLDSDLKGFKLKIIGTGPSLKEIKKQYDIESISYLDELTNQNTLDLIKNSAAVVTATKLYEVQPNLLCEASSCSIPSIFPDNGGISEYFPSGNTLNYESNNYYDLTKKLNQVLNKKLMKEVGITNYNFLKEMLNEETLVKKFKSIINEK